MSLFEKMFRLGRLKAEEADLERQVRASSTTWIPGKAYGWPQSRPGLLGRLGSVRGEIKETERSEDWP
jgi:hypothetical protein